MSFPAAEPSRVVPARLATLSIYNPSLGATDETVRDQILYYYSRKNREKQENAAYNGTTDRKEKEEEENERLRQVGLAQGMVNFANNFSDGKAVSSIETEKSRIIVHELESGWWILASIDFTRILQPAKANEKSSRLHIEYSMREVSPPQLLLKQVLRAQSIFLLHHAATLTDLYQRLGRASLCNMLEKYWTSFALGWDVLLHGNPAVDMYNGVKLAAGGELGVGVGEEEFGSGEREVLEDFVNRTEGLVDLVVSRFGDAPKQPESESPSRKNAAEATRHPSPWLGTDADPRSSDGVIFSGVGAVSRRSLATISQWMEAIFQHEDEAYGVGESPVTSRHRKKRGKASTKPRKPKQTPEATVEEPHLVAKHTQGRAADLRRVAMERNAAPPNIPPSLVPVVERTPENAVANVDANQSPKPKDDEKEKSTQNEESSVFGTEKMMKYLSLGYGSSWTLSPKGLPDNKIEAEENASQYQSESTPTKSPSHSIDDIEPENSSLQQIDPTPEVSDEDEPFVQRLEQSIGKFIIGLSGDLENTEFLNDVDNPNQYPQAAPKRMFLRTLTLGMSTSTMGPVRRASRGSTMSHRTSDEPPTSASASVDGAQSISHHRKVQVAVYVHQPFMFVFLFQLHTPSLTMPSFYQNIHHQLGPLQKPLLKSTDPTNVAIRIAEAMGENSIITTTISPPRGDQSSQTIYDVIYDPVTLTVRTSIPNIPIPGSLAAEGLNTTSSSLTISGSWYTLGIPIGTTSSFNPSPSPRQSSLTKTDWTRIDALNVHTQLLSTWIATRDASETERTVKTARGWWILWMQVPAGYGLPKEAFLVRKAGEQKVVRDKGRSGGGGAGRWLLREQGRDVSGETSVGGSTGAGEQVTTSASVSEGVGVDARKWIDGLLHLSR